LRWGTGGWTGSCICGATHRCSCQREVGTGDPSLVGKVDGNGAVSKEGAKTRKGGGVVVNIVRSVVVANLGGIDLAVLSGEVTNLAGLGELAVTGRSLDMPLGLLR